MKGKIKLKLTKRQMQSILKVEKAMKEAESKGVHFWDNYGTMTAYNDNKITMPVPLHNESYIKEDDILLEWYNDVVYDLDVNNFHAGNADDPLHFKAK